MSKDGESIAYVINSQTVLDGSTAIPDVPFIVWQGKGNITAEQLTAPRVPHSAKDPVEEWLRQELKDGEWHSSSALLAKAGEFEFHEKKVKRVATKLKVERQRVGMPAQVEWHLPREGHADVISCDVQTETGANAHA